MTRGAQRSRTSATGCETATTIRCGDYTTARSIILAIDGREP